MGAHSITLDLPAPLYEHFERRARQARRSVEAELLQTVTRAVPTGQKDAPADPSQDIEMGSDSRELSVEEAAALLNVSPAYVIRLFRSGELPYQGSGDRRRVALGDLVSYKRSDLTRRRQLLAELTAEAQDMGLDY